MQHDTYTCPHCRMTFRVGSPQMQGDFERCGHKFSSGELCGQRMWTTNHTGRTGRHSVGFAHVRVGIEPQDLPA